MTAIGQFIELQRLGWLGSSGETQRARRLIPSPQARGRHFRAAPPESNCAGANEIFFTAQSLLVGIVPSGRTVALEHERIKLVQGLWVSRTPENEAAEASALRAFQVSLLADKRAVFAPLQEYGVQIEQDFDSLAVVLVRVPGDALRRILDSSGVRSVSANAKVELN